MWRKVASCSYLWIILGILSMTVSLAVDLVMGTHVWFHRSGALLVICGAMLGTRKFVRLGIKEALKELTEIDAGHFSPTPEEIRKEQEIRYDVWSAKVGLFFLAIGTLIWAYGDLIPRL